MQQPDSLSDAARDIRLEVARLDAEYREKNGRPPSGPELARLLHARYVLVKKRWWQR